MVGYADAELLVGEWLRDTLEVKLWDDPRPPVYQRYTSPLVHLLRGPGSEPLVITLDGALLDCDVYAAEADHARKVAHDIWSAMVFTLPGHTFANGVFVKRVTAEPAPFWISDPKWCRRSATYRVILHGVIP